MNQMNQGAMNPVGDNLINSMNNTMKGPGQMGSLSNAPNLPLNMGPGQMGMGNNGPMPPMGGSMNHMMMNNGPNGMQGSPMGMYGPPKPMPVSAGKVYPADQPMVFNPQNPNAPPIYPCGVCHKEVHENDQALLCESGCNFWFHR